MAGKCPQMWRDAAAELRFCGNLRGHGGECQDERDGLFYSETVEMI